MNLFSEAIKQKKVRNGVYAYLYPNGRINIEGQKYFGFSVTEAIKNWRNKNKLRK